MRAADGSVLIVSNEAELGEGIRLALRRLGIASILATTAVDAVQRIAEGSPGAVVIDLRFSDMDPQQIVHRAMACRATHGLPIVAIGEPEDRESLMEGGCTAILHRDTTPLAAADVIAQLVRTRIGSDDNGGGMGLRLQPNDPPPRPRRSPGGQKPEDPDGM